MIEKFRSMFISVLVMLMLSGVVLSLCALKLGFDFPEWTHIGDTESTLEGREYTEWRNPTGSALLKGSFQERFEAFIADHVPMRDAVLLASAGMERQPIGFMAGVAGYEAYPTFFGSDYVVVPSDGIVVERSKKIPRRAKKLNRLLDTLNDVASSYEDVNMSVGLVTEPRHSAGNPSYALMGGDGLINEEWVQTRIVDKLDPKLNARVEGIGDYDKLKDTWRSTDVHWTLKRALDAYNKTAEDLGLEHVEWSDELAFLVKDAWYGNAARIGRDYDFASDLVDQRTLFPGLKYYGLGEVGEGREIPAGMRDDLIRGDAATDDVPMEGLNKKYFGGENYEIVNEGDNNGKTCLIVGDSFIRPIFRYIANNYAHTIMVLPGNYKTELSFKELIGKYEVDDCIVLMQCQKYSSIVGKSPNFLE